MFSDNLASINAHNSRLGVTHKEGLNNFAFMTKQEFQKLYLSEFPSVEGVEVEQTHPIVGDVDWVSYGAVSPVKT